MNAAVLTAGYPSRDLHIFANLTLRTTLWERCYYYAHFMDELI